MQWPMCSDFSGSRKEHFLFSNFLPLVLIPEIFFFKKLFLLIGGYLLYNIVVVFAIYRHESPTGAYVSLHPVSPSHLPPHPIPEIFILEIK